MKNEIARVKLFVKNTQKAHELEKILKEELLNNSFEISDSAFDLAISVGGDGTFLKMLHHANFDDSIYYASINAGSLGFLSSVDRDNVKKFIKDIKNGFFSIKNLSILDSQIYLDNQKNNLYCINELTIRKNDFSSLRCDILVDDTLLDKYVGDGLVITTSTGSTGYNLALGGPIIDNDIKAIVIKPIVPIINKVYKSLNNAIVFNEKKKISFIFDDSNNLCLLNDGKINNMNNIIKVECQLSKKNIKCLIPSDYSYINNIKSKIIE